MLSRVADSLYWMSRYLERAEHAARVMELQLNLMLEQDPDSVDRRWTLVLAALGHKEPVEGEVSSDAFGQARDFAFEQIMEGIESARENARQVREQISSEMWEQLNRMFHESRSQELMGLWETQPTEFLGLIKRKSHLFQGVTDSTMSHNEGWHFIQVGRFLERAHATAQLVDAHFREYPQTPDSAIDSAVHAEWAGVLRCCTAFEAYCKVYTAELRPGRVADFLLLNPDFPHSIRFAADAVQHSLEAIHQTTDTRRSANLARLAGRLSSGLTYTPLEEIVGSLHAFLGDVQRTCVQIHGTIYNVYVQYPVEAALAEH
jgi:uncharacterized alpha-E superfamily protein